MKDEILERATKLRYQINELTTQKGSWDEATGFDKAILDVNGRSGYLRIKTEYINFSVLRAVTIQSLSEQIEAKQTEYDNL